MARVLLVCLLILGVGGRALAQQVAGPDELMRRAQAQFDVGHGREAVALYDEAAKAFAGAGNLPGQMRALQRSGETLKLMGEPAKATPALALARRIGDASIENQVLSELAAAASDSGDLPTAISTNRDVLSRAEATHDAGSAAIAAGRLGDALLNSDQPREAARAFGRAATLFHAANRPPQEILALRRQGLALARAEQYLAAAEAFQQSATLAHDTADAAQESSALKGAGEQRSRLGDYQAAVDDFESAVRLARRAGDRTLEGSALMSLGNVRYFQRQTEAAIEAYDESLEAARATKDRAMEGESLGNLALAYTRLDQYDKAEGYFRQDIDIARERKDRLDEAQALGNLGSMLVQAHRDAKAIQPLGESRDIAASLHYQRGVAIALRNLGLAQYRTGALAAAEASLRQTLDEQDALRSQAAGADRFNISLFDTQLEAYDSLQAVLAAEHQPEAALEISERGRGRALADLLSARNGGPATAARLAVASIREVAHRRGATLIEYSIVQADSALYVWVVRPSGEVAFRRIAFNTHGGALETALQGLVRDSRATLGALGPKDVPAPKKGVAGADEMLSLLHRILIAPIADLLPAEPDRPVVLIPQGPLFLVPFAALRDDDGKPLVVAHALSVAPSIQTLDLLDAGGAAAAGPALVVGNPALGPVRLDPGSEDETMLPPLPEAEREARTVAELLGGRALVGAAATRNVVIDRMAGAGTIHLATHGVAEDIRGRGLPGALALAPDPNDDGLLSTGDIMGLRLHADLVVLSACNTGLGNLSGDGVIGLSRAFLAAGARGVIVSLWYVPDQATADLMEAFYRAFARTRQKAVALRAAMLETRAKHPNPLAWAGFLLVGDGT